MGNLTELDVKKKAYVIPALDVVRIDWTVDVLCLSKEESHDNEFDAGDLGL